MVKKKRRNISCSSIVEKKKKTNIGRKSVATVEDTKYNTSTNHKTSAKNDLKNYKYELCTYIIYYGMCMICTRRENVYVKLRLSSNQLQKSLHYTRRILCFKYGFSVSKNRFSTILVGEGEESQNVLCIWSYTNILFWIIVVLNRDSIRSVIVVHSWRWTLSNEYNL